MSASTQQTEIDIQGVNGDATAAATGVEYGKELMLFAQAIANRDIKEITESRANLYKVAGPLVVVDAAAVAANFQRMVRIADSIGIPIDDMTVEVGIVVRSELELSRFASAQNSAAARTAPT